MHRLHYCTRQVLKLVRGDNAEGIKFDRIVIDTAPTGHTLRMLSYPEFLDEFFEKIIKIRGRYAVPPRAHCTIPCLTAIWFLRLVNTACVY
jgi:anion-transporting  ArsA/GET3 family ATPase